MDILGSEIGSFTVNGAEAPISFATKPRPKSTGRITYEAEATLIRRKIGDLKVIRNTLGVSQKKFCQLLMVDPSAFTRWTQEGQDAPPHIYRSLQWYLALQEKYPALDVEFWLGTRTKSIDSLRNELHGYQQAAEVRINDLFAEKKQLEKKVARLRALVVFATGASVLLFVVGAAAVFLLRK